MSRSAMYHLQAQSSYKGILHTLSWDSASLNLHMGHLPTTVPLGEQEINLYG